MVAKLLHEARSTVARNATTALRLKLQKGEMEGTVTSYSKVFNYLIKTYATDDVIARTLVDNMQFTQTSNK